MTLVYHLRLSPNTLSEYVEHNMIHQEDEDEDPQEDSPEDNDEQSLEYFNRYIAGDR